MRCVVTGANRGIGLEFVRQLLARGDTVTAAVRDAPGARALNELRTSAGERLRVMACDVANEASVAAFAKAYGNDPLDLLVNNAGVYGGDAQSIDEMDFANAMRTFEINALGPLRVTLALRGQLARGHAAKVVSVTSGMGSIEDNTSGGFYAYRMSKAALNMTTRSLAVDLREDGIATAVISPGWVQTDMGGRGAPTPVDESVRGMLREIDALTIANTGSFLNWRGGGFPW